MDTRIQAMGTMLAVVMLAVAGTGAAFELASGRVDANGGGLVAGGSYAAFVTIAATGPAGPMHGSVYEATAGIERRRGPRGEAIFGDGFETGVVP